MLKEFGYDMGVKPRMIIVGDMEFANHYHSAVCIGIGYIFKKAPDQTMIPVEMGFMCIKENEADKFLDSLLSWVENSGGDGEAVAIEFIEQNNGDYVVSISPEQMRLIKRTVPKNLQNKVDPIMMIIAQGKGGIKISKNYLDFKNGYKEGKRIVVRYYIVENNQITKASEKYFVKTTFKFYKQSEIPPDSISRALFSKNKSLKGLKPQKLLNPSIKQIADNRIQNLKTFFPILHTKFFNDGWLKNLFEQFKNAYSESEFLQAVCNLVLLERLKKDNPDNINIEEPGLDMRILLHLTKTYESFSSYTPTETYFTKESLAKQLSLNKNYLSEYLSK
jgi:hypothetical protein